MNSFWKDLKDKEPSGPFVERNADGYMIWLLDGADVDVVYKEGDRVLVAGVRNNRPSNIFSAILIWFFHFENYRLSSESIRCWDNQELVTNDERKLIITRIRSFFKHYVKRTLRVVNDNQ